MSNETIRALLKKLQSELQNTELNAETIEQMRGFENAIEPYLTSETIQQAENSLLEQAQRLEISFAQQHPVAEGVMQEIADSLSKMGI